MITLVLGGTRSGKSAVAERLAGRQGGPVTYVATAHVDHTDRDHVERVLAHQRRRPAGWATIECSEPDALVHALAAVSHTILVDSMGTWLASHHNFVTDTEGLVDVLASRTDPTILVSEEVGLAVHPPTELGRSFVDAMGTLNQHLAAVADRSLLVVAGRVLELNALEDRWKPE